MDFNNNILVLSLAYFSPALGKYPREKKALSLRPLLLPGIVASTALVFMEMKQQLGQFLGACFRRVWSDVKICL